MFIYNKFLIAGCSMLLISACSPRITKEVTSVKAPGEKTEETTIDIAALPAAEIPLGGNAFITSEDRPVQANNTSISNWKNTESVVSVYFKALQAGTYYLSLKAKTADSSRISVKIAEKKEELKMPISSTFEETAKLQFKVNKPGYVRVDLQAISKTTEIFTQIRDLVIRGENAKTLAYVKNNEKHRFHFGRRGPSVHLNFIVPDSSKEKVEYFYNEIRVPKGQDVIGSYFQADGFSYGYFGMQVNSATERRILFSVWSPFQTDNPNEIPEEDKIILIKKGASVYIGEFGNEGSGGQSYMRFNWKPETNYAFLLKAAPDAATERTVFTAYFKEVNTDEWSLIASFSRPKTNTYLKHLYSFLENFNPERGYIQRKALFTNQWIRTTDNKWTAIDKIKFTADDIATRGERLDYRGGVEGNSFFLENCGFFDDNTKINTEFKRKLPANATPPDIDFSVFP